MAPRSIKNFPLPPIPPKMQLIDGCGKLLVGLPVYRPQIKSNRSVAWKETTEPRLLIHDRRRKPEPPQGRN
jgi:hypothetical protein